MNPINILVDGNNIAIRTLNAIPGYNSQFQSPHQFPFFIHSFLSNLLSVTKRIKQKYEKYPINLVLIWDSKTNFRKNIYPEYKANRKSKTIEEEKDRINHYSLLNELRENLNILGSWGNISLDGFEADDLIAYLIKEVSYGNQFIIVSSDNDFYQLLGDRIIQYLPHKKVFYSHLDFKKEFGVIPEKYIYIKALAGDNGDNIKGIEGIGIKKATKMIQQGQCWNYWVNKFKDVDLEMNIELIRLPFKSGEGINIEMPKSFFCLTGFTELFQKFSLQKLNLFDFKQILQ